MNLCVVYLSFFLGTGVALGQAALTPSVVVALLDDGAGFRVPVSVFGRTNFVLVDTGSSATALDLRFRERLSEMVRRQSQEYIFYRSPEIRLGQRSLELSEVLCTDLTMLKLITGEPMDGILGLDFLKNHVVELDFDRGAVSIDAETPAPLKKVAWKVPLIASNQRDFTIGAILNDRVTINLLVDTGDSDAMTLNQADWDRVFPSDDNSQKHKSMFAGSGGKVTESYKTRVRGLNVGGHNYSNMICSLNIIPNSASALGLGFLRRHLVIIDFPNRMCYLRPGNQFNAKEDADMSGLHLLRRDGLTLVHSVDEGSPAMLAGIQAGDSVVSINRKVCGDTNMKQIREMLKTGNGDKVFLEIQRNRKVVKTEFLLKRFL